MYQLLKGLKIIDLTTIVLGPYATKILGDLGADVVKIEPIGGDQFRSVRPGRSPELGAGFVNLNVNKRSVSIDLSKAEGREVLNALLLGADAVVHNMRPKSAAKFGLTYEALKALKPDIIFCYAPGFGQDGDYADQPAYDDTIQAASGIAHLNANASGEPRFLPTIVGDKVGGLHLALSVLAGVAYHARTGEGCCIEAPMFESVVSFLLVEQLAGQSFVPPLGGMGYDRLLSPNRKPFATSDGFISILPYSTAHWTRFLRAIGRDDLAGLDWVVDPVRRSQNIDPLYRAIGEATSSRSTDEWCELLRRLDIPCARVNRPDELLTDPHLVSAGFFGEYEHPSEGRMKSARSPLRVIDGDTRTDLPAPGIGADTMDVLTEAGFAAKDIHALEERGIVKLGAVSASMKARA